jgi:hypothetical protein
MVTAMLTMGAAAVWLLALLTTVVVRMQWWPPRPAPDVHERPDDLSPALVNLLVTRKRPTHAALHATLLELVRREAIELYWPVYGDPEVAFVRVITSRPNLDRLQRQLYVRISRSAVDGVVPLSHLRLGEPTWRLTGGDIAADARHAGLTEPRFPVGVVTALVWTALVPIGLAAIKVMLDNRQLGIHIVVQAGGMVVLVQTFVSLFLPWLLAGQNLRPAGRAATRRWLGYRRYLKDAPADRHDPYRVALGFPGPLPWTDPHGRLWSSWTGRWRPVRVLLPEVYPSDVPGPGSTWVTGEVLTVGRWATKSDGDDSEPTPWLHHLAVDDGTSDDVVGWVCPSGLAEPLGHGDVVTIRGHVGPRLITDVQVRRQALRPPNWWP